MVIEAIERRLLLSTSGGNEPEPVEATPLQALEAAVEVVTAEGELSEDAIDAEGAVVRIEYAAANLVDAVMQDAAALEASFVHDVARLYASAALLAEEQESGEDYSLLTQEQADRVAGVLTALGGVLELHAEQIATSEAGAELAWVMRATAGGEEPMSGSLLGRLWSYVTGRGGRELTQAEEAAADLIEAGAAEYAGTGTSIGNTASGGLDAVAKGFRITYIYRLISDRVDETQSAGGSGGNPQNDLVLSYLEKIKQGKYDEITPEMRDAFWDWHNNR